MSDCCGETFSPREAICPVCSDEYMKTYFNVCGSCLTKRIKSQQLIMPSDNEKNVTPSQPHKSIAKKTTDDHDLDVSEHGECRKNTCWCRR